MRVIDGKYRVLKELGAGFGGRVYLTEANKQKFALKRLDIQTDVLSPEEVLENFRQEFSTLKELNHPHILRIHDFGYDSKEKFYYFTTDYISGLNIFEGTEASTPEEIEEFMVQTLRALSYLHSQNVFHLDIKPANMLIEKGESGEKIAKLIDFGLARFQSKGLVFGSPSYLAPEALLKEPLDGRTDLYALGITWYECLARKNPFRADQLEKILDLQKVWMPPPISSQDPRIPKYLDPILEKILKKNPAERYHRADQVIRDINWIGSKQYPLETEATALSYLPGEGQLVGREKEWAQLKKGFDRVFGSKTDNRLCIILRGPSGAGKSRLLKELKYHAQLRTIPVLQVTDGVLPVISCDSLIFWDDATEEDLQNSLKWLHQFSTHAAMVVLSGTKLDDPTGDCLQINLQNFNKEDVSHYVASVLGVKESPDFLVEELFHRSEGNPLFLTELLRALLQSHQIFDEQGRWSPSLLHELGVDFEKLGSLGTIDDYCRSKYQKLNFEAQRILVCLAFAKESPDRSFALGLGGPHDPHVWNLLDEEKLVGIDSFGKVRLLNPHFRDWISRNVDSEDIAAGHQKLGDYFQAHPQHQEVSWYHLGHGTGSASDRYQWLLRYGEQLRERHQWSEATQIYQTAYGLVSDPERQVQARFKEVEALFRAGRHATALTLLQEMGEMLKKAKSNPQQWKWVQESLREMGSFYIKEGRLDLAHESLEASRVLLEQHDENPIEMMRLDNFKASLLMREGKISEAESISEETFEKWRGLSQADKSLVLNNELPNIYLALGKIDEAKKVLKEQVQFFRDIKHRAKEAYALYGWGLCSYLLQDYDDAEEHYKECEEVSRQLRNEELLLHVYNGLGNIALDRQNWDRAAEDYGHALELAQHNASLDGSVAIAINLAVVYRHQGDDHRAHLYIRHVIDTLEAQFPPSIHQLHVLIQAYIHLGQLNLDRQRWLDARDAFRDAARNLHYNHALDQYRFATFSGWAEAATEMQQTEEAQKALAEVAKLSLSSQEKKDFEGVKKRMSLYQ